MDEEAAAFWQTEDFNRLMSVSEDELFAELGQSIPGAQLSPRDATRAIAYGRAWYASKKNEFVERVCQNENVSELIKRGESYDRMMEFAAIADALLTLVGMPWQLLPR